MISNAIMISIITFFGTLGFFYFLIEADKWSRKESKKKEEKSDMILTEIQEIKRQLGNELYQSKKSLESERRRWRVKNDI